MDFCPECGGMILAGTKCNTCGYDINGFNFRNLKIGVPRKYISDKSNYKNNYEALLYLILNKKQVYFTKKDILENSIKIIDIANDNFINKEKKIISRKFTKEINSQVDFIDENKCLLYKSKYNKDYFPYYDKLNFKGEINNFNLNFIEKRRKEIYSQFKKDLKLINKPLTDEDIEKFKNKFTEYGHDFFTELDMQKKINEKLIDDAFNIIRNEYGDSDSLISKEKLSELKSNYPYFEWNIIVKKYNMQFDKKNFEPHKTTDNVYYLHDYIIRDNWKYSDRNQVRISKKILKYKNGVNKVVIDFTNELIDFIEEFIEYELDNNVKQIFLISVPSSTQSRDKNSSIKKTINIIADKYEKGLIISNAKIIDLNELLYRKIDITASHKKRQSYKVHMKTIGLNKNKLENVSNGIFILLDDIATTGNILNACSDILINNGVDSKNIYKIVIAATG